MEPNFSVQIEKFTERHFIKSFEKKYKGYWDVTLKAITYELERVESLLLNTNRAEIIKDNGNTKVLKIDFRVAGTKESAKTSGNRCIVLLNKEKRNVSILLLYGKTDLSGHNETAEWTRIIKDNYPNYREFF